MSPRSPSPIPRSPPARNPSGESETRKAGQVLAALSLTAVLGGMAVLFHQPLLFASIGPTILIVIHEPERGESRVV